MMGIMENIKDSEHGSTLMSVQPPVNELTHVLHPIFPSIYGHFLKEKEESGIKFEMRKESY